MANSNNMCRLCLSANGITEPLCYDQRDQFLLQKIYECTTLQIAPLNGIPSSLCTICKARLDEFYQFRWQCIKNDEIIRRIADNFQKQSIGGGSNGSEAEPNGGPTPAAATAVVGEGEHNPKQEIIEPTPLVIGHPNGELQISAVEGGGSSSEYNTPEGRRSDERDAYRHPEHVDQPNYDVDHAHVGHHAVQYGMGHGMGTTATGGDFAPETKYSHHQHPHPSFEFTDFRRKRGRPPKQKYDQYHHPIVKYGESSTDGSALVAVKDCSSSSSTATTTTTATTLMEEPEAMLSYGEGSSRGGEYQHQPHVGYGTWPPQPKIKLEHLEQQPGRYDEQVSPVEVSPDGRDTYMKLPLNTSTTQTLLTPDGFVKRSRGRPPREGGCPNQDRTEYRFQCQFCEARFKAAINLKLHTNTHTGERPYKCTLCDKSFAHPSNLSVHTKLHTQERVKREGHSSASSEKKFQCPYCHTLFALAFQLKIHINTHTGQKPYVCKNCGKGFAQPSNLHVHVKKHCHKRMEFEGNQPAPPLPLPLPPPPSSQQQLQPRAQIPLHHHPEEQPHHYQPIVMHHHQQVLTVVPIPPQPHSPEGGHAPPVSVEHQHQQEQHHSPPTGTSQPHPLSGMPPVMLA